MNHDHELLLEQAIRSTFDMLTAAEKQAMLGALNPDTFLGARSPAISCMFMDTGVRLEEQANLKEGATNLTEKAFDSGVFLGAG